jgi:endonuclease/exonuclease/phosphatase family metal-dependent hydrolase
MNKTNSSFLLLCTVMFFVFFQLLTSLIEATYTFGLLGTSIPPEIGYILFLLSPLLLLFDPRILEGRSGRVFTLITAAISLVSWAFVLFLDTRGRMIASAVGAGSILLFFPAFIKQRPSATPGISLGGGLAFSSLITILVHQKNYGSGLLPAGISVIFPIAILFVAALDLDAWFRSPIPTINASVGSRKKLRPAVNFLGVSCILILIYFAFNSPAVIARWTGASYAWVVGLCTAAAAFFLIWLFSPSPRIHRLPPYILIIWNVFFCLSLIFTILPFQINFPLDPSSTAYPLAEPAAGLLPILAMVGMLLLHPVLYIDAIFLLEPIASGEIASRQLVGGMLLLAIFQLVLSFAHIFTTVYDYIPVIGPFFRDRFWLVYALPCLILVLCLIPYKASFPWAFQPSFRRWPALTAALLALITFLVVARASLLPTAQPSSSGLRVMTYNLQQGYSRNGQKNFSGQLAVIQQRQPDILGLQETDTARIAGGNTDLVRYLATNLHMYSYYGPKTITGTFGIALLSRYPLENPHTDYLYSLGEQTAVIEAQVIVKGQTYTIMVTHLGNDGPLIQQQQILQIAQGKNNLLLMGDFNFRPPTEQYLQTVALLQDSLVITAEKKVDPLVKDLDRRIDHIFLSSGIQVASYEYFGEGPSDHPGVIIQVKPLP